MSGNLTETEREGAGAFVRRVAGLPWRAGASGPDAYDCFGLAQAAQRELFGRELPILSASRHAMRDALAQIARGQHFAGWVQVARPLHGDLITLRHQNEPQHIGVWLAIDRGRLLHAVEGAGVCFDPKPLLEITGWGCFRYYHQAAAH